MESKAGFFSWLTCLYDGKTCAYYTLEVMELFGGFETNPMPKFHDDSLRTVTKSC